MEEAGMDEGEAEEVAIESIANVLEDGGAAEGDIDKTASAEEVPEEGCEECGDTPVDDMSDDEIEVGSAVGELIENLAAKLQEEDPEISDDEALEAATDQVADALETVEAQQAIGASDEEGNPVVADEDAAAAVDEMEKSASAYPLRGELTTALNMRLGLSPEAFAARLNIQ